MGNIITYIRDAILDANKYEKKLCVASIDQQKAFDSIDHDYVFGCVKNVIGNGNFRENIKRMYDSSWTKIKVGEYCTNKIIIKSGIKQGCPMSMWLYAVEIEELLCKIRKSK